MAFAKNSRCCSVAPIARMAKIPRGDEATCHDFRRTAINLPAERVHERRETRGPLENLAGRPSRLREPLQNRSGRSDQSQRVVRSRLSSILVHSQMVSPQSPPQRRLLVERKRNTRATQPLRIFTLKNDTSSRLGGCQDSCRLKGLHAACCSGVDSEVGFSHTSPTWPQFRVAPDHRFGLRA